jgi:hypothetical protein
MSDSTFAAVVATIIALTSQAASSEQAADLKRVKEPAREVLFDDLPGYRDFADRVTATEARRFLVIGQASDPNAAKSGLIDTDAVIRAICRESANGNLPSWGMLDFEDPFHELLQQGPSNPKCVKTVSELVRTIEAVRRAFPGTKWTYYGMPWLPYWLDGGKDWTTASKSDANRHLERCIAIYRPIADACDWISPTIYGKYDPSLFPEPDRERIRQQGRAWRTAQVGVALMLSKGRPVIPIACPWWTPGGKADFCRLMNPKEFMEDQAGPALEVGAQGIAVWGALTYQIERMTAADQSPYVDERGFGVREWRAAVVKDYLGGREPRDWSDPAIGTSLRRSMSESMVGSMENVKSWTGRRPSEVPSTDNQHQQPSAP